MPGHLTARREALLARSRLVVPLLVLLGALVALLLNTARPLTNTDTYFHLRFGEEFLGPWSLRHPGSVTTFATRPWVPTQWLSEVVMARTEQWLGLAGVALLSGLLQLGLLVALYAVARRRADAWVAMPVAAVALWTMQYGLSARPQVVSYLLVAVVTGAWLQTSDDRRVRWWLVPLVWLWAMLHGMWPLAIAIGGVALVGLALDRTPLPVLGRGAAVIAGSALVAALTPVGPELYRAVAAVGARRSYFVEWQTPEWVSWPGLGIAVLVVGTVVGLWRRRRISWTELLLFVLAVGLAAWSRRTVPVAAAMLAPLAAGALQGLAGRRTPVDRRERLTVALAVGAAAVVLAVAVPFTSDDPAEQPGWVDPALSALPAGTKVLDDWGYGGYLMWRYPQLDLMMHGYGDTFTTAELDRNERLLALSPGWETDLRESGARVAVLRPSMLADVLADREHWVVRHESGDLVMLQAPSDWSALSPPVSRGFGSAR
jgi:hypothetical protein